MKENKNNYEIFVYFISMNRIIAPKRYYYTQITSEIIFHFCWDKDYSKSSPLCKTENYVLGFYVEKINMKRVHLFFWTIKIVTPSTIFFFIYIYSIMQFLGLFLYIERNEGRKMFLLSKRFYFFCTYMNIIFWSWSTSCWILLFIFSSLI